MFPGFWKEKWNLQDEEMESLVRNPVGCAVFQPEQGVAMERRGQGKNGEDHQKGEERDPPFKMKQSLTVITEIQTDQSVSILYFKATQVKQSRSLQPELTDFKRKKDLADH